MKCGLTNVGRNSMWPSVSLCFCFVDYVVKARGNQRSKCLVATIARTVNPVVAERFQQQFKIWLQILDRCRSGGSARTFLHPTLLLRAVAPQRKRAAKLQDSLILLQMWGKF